MGRDINLQVVFEICLGGKQLVGGLEASLRNTLWDPCQHVCACLLVQHLASLAGLLKEEEDALWAPE